MRIIAKFTATTALYVGLTSALVPLVSAGPIGFRTDGWHVSGAVVIGTETPSSSRQQSSRESPTNSADVPTVSPDIMTVFGDVGRAERVALVIYDAEKSPPSRAPPPYDATLAFGVHTKLLDPLSEASRLRLALGTLPFSRTKIDIWAEGLAGLILRSAIETPNTPISKNSFVVFVDTPNRGLSTSGWPNWNANDGQTVSAPYSISGSRFLVDLNAPRSSPAQYINVWRMVPQASPRATVMQLPRAAVAIVVRAASAEPIWSILEEPIIALREMASSGPAPRTRTDGPTFKEQDAKRYAPVKVSGNAPSIRAVLTGSFRTPVDRTDRWIQYEMPPVSRGRTEDPFSRMTDPVGIVYQPKTGKLIVFGFEDYLREPLSSDLFYTALSSFPSSGYLAISIDPPRANDPPGQFPVRYVGVGATKLGGVLFEVDRVAKSLSLGKDNITGVPVTSGVSTYRSIAESLPQEIGTDKTVWRLWFQPERWHAKEDGPYSAIVDTRMECAWEKMTPGYAPSAGVTHFADLLTQRYTEYSQEQPSLDQLDQAAALVAVARWAHEANFRPSATHAKAPRVDTPTYTPMAEVRTQFNSDLYQVTHVLQGGVLLGDHLRHVRERSGVAGALRAQSQAQQYGPEAQALSTAPLHATAWGYMRDESMMRAVLTDTVRRVPGRNLGILQAKDSISDPPLLLAGARTYQDLFPWNRPLITLVTVDDSAEPSQVIMKGTMFGSGGTALMNGHEVPTPTWHSDTIVIDLPSLVTGTLQLKTTLGYSNPVEITLVPGAVRKEPPTVTISNRADFVLHILFEAHGYGSSREFDIFPGSSQRTRLLPGKYTIKAMSASALTVAASQEERSFERGYTYSLTFDQAAFPLGVVTVRNSTGSTIQMNLSGPVTQVLSVPSGVPSTVRLPFGSYSLNVVSSCGTASRTLVVSAGSTNVLSYECHETYRRRY